jgi:hypothetical protein
VTLAAMGPLGESLAAWLLTPVVLVAVAFGLGLLVEAVARTRIATALLAPVGFCTLIVLAMPVFRLGAGAWLAVPVVLLGALAGLWLGRRELRTRLSPRPLALTGVAAYGLYVGTVVLAGGWTWTGYNFVNDTAVQMLLADWLAGHGTGKPVAPTVVGARSTAAESLRIYLETGYPLGSHGALAVVSKLVPAPLAAVYQPFIATVAALSAVSLGALARRCGLGAIAAALAGLAAMAANLPFVYALQGNVKEIAMAACLAVAAAVGREAIDSERPVGHIALVAICLGAAITAFSAAGVPYAAAFAAVLLGAALLARHSTLRRRLLPAAAVGALVLLVATAATLVKIVRFGQVAEGTFSSGAAAAADLGHLLRPLELVQAAGVWLAPDYRGPVPDGRAGLNAVLIAAVLLLCVGGAIAALRRREPGPLLILLPALITFAVLEHRTSPYATAKMIMLASPGIVLCAGVALGWLAQLRRARLVAVALAAVLGGSMLLSDALAYHDVQLAPVDRMQALEQIGDRLSGEPRPIGQWLLEDEYEEFAKFFMRRANENTALEVVTADFVGNELSIGLIPRHADLDQMTLDFLSKHPLIAQRRGADSSRPPANYVRDGGTPFYDVWRRTDDVEVRAHVPLQSLFEGYGEPDCATVRDLARQARDGERIVAAPALDEVRLDPTTANKPRDWPLDPELPGTVRPVAPAAASAELDFPASGRWRTWVFGSTGRPLHVRVDGRDVGQAEGVNTPGEWLGAGEAEIGAGRRTVEIVRPTGSMKPGDGYVGRLGPVVFQRVQPQELEWVAPDDAAARLCGRRLDWVELARQR